jgi:alkanesulfonate monooxygenase SsuD/methylene tetrahydromethanopterin reductase-like flavin-dependent oxidoreductase (luciferase family)
VFVGRTEDEWRDRARAAWSADPTAGPFDDYLADLERDCIVGPVDRAVERMRAYAEAGVRRFVLNHGLFDDLDQIELLATEIIPRVDG